MKQLGISLLAAVAFILTGCAAPIGQVTTNYDKFKDSSAEIVQVGQTVRLIRIAEKQQSPTYAFVVEGYSSGNRAAWPDELVFLLDGEQMRLKGGSSLEDVSVSRYGVSYYERAIFPVTGDQILRVSKASNVEVRMYGRNGAFPGVTWVAGIWPWEGGRPVPTGPMALGKGSALGRFGPRRTRAAREPFARISDLPRFSDRRPPLPRAANFRSASIRKPSTSPRDRPDASGEADRTAATASVSPSCTAARIAASRSALLMARRLERTSDARWESHT
jgi:hypothetical protein